MGDSKITDKFTFLGKPLTECTKEELISCIKSLYKNNILCIDAHCTGLKDENSRLKVENEKLWRVIGYRGGD